MSPYAYIASETLERRLPGIKVQYTPIYLRGLEAFSKGMPFSPAKVQYMARDLARIAAHKGVPHKLPSVFPINGLYGCRGATWVLQHAPGKFQDYHRAVYRATWAENRNISDKQAVIAIAASVGLDEKIFAAGIEEEAIKEALKARTADAAGRGVFGVPSFFVGKDLFWGHDRMDYVLRAVKGA